MTIRNRPKRTRFVNGGLELLQMISKPGFGWCASEDARPQRGVDCEIPHRLERGTKHPYKGVETSPQQTRFKTREANGDT